MLIMEPARERRALLPHRQSFLKQCPIHWRGQNMKRMLSRFALSLIFIIANNVPLQSMVLPKGDSKVSGSQNQIIDDPEANAFVQEGLSYAIELYGEPRISVKKVVLRYKPQGSPFTNLPDARKGLFTIILTHKPTEY